MNSPPEWLRAILQSIGDAAVTTDAERSVTFLNTLAESLTGWDSSEAFGKPLAGTLTLLDPETRLPIPPADPDLSESVSGIPALLVGKDGREIPIEYNVSTIKDESATRTGMLWIFREANDLRGVERELDAAITSEEETERLFRYLTDIAPFLIWMSGTDTVRLFFNRPWLEFTGRSLEEESGNGWMDGIHPDDLQQFRETHLSAFQARQTALIEYRLRRHDGEYRWIHEMSEPRHTPEGEFNGYIGSCIDIHDRRLAEEERDRTLKSLREREKELSLITNAVPVLIAYVDKEHRYRFNNRKYEEWFGFKSIDMVGKHLQEVVGDAAYEAIKPYVEAALSGQEVVYETEVDYLNRGHRYIRGHYIPDREESGEVAGYVALVMDITSQKKTEEAVRRSEEQLRSIVDNVIDGIITIDDRGTVQSFNPAAERIFGYKSEEVIGRNVKMLMPEHEARQHNQYLRNYLGTGEPRIIGIGREVTGQRKDGSTFPLDLAVGEFQMGQDRYFTGIIRDITDRKRMEAQLQQRAEALLEADRRKDEFLAMLAHELRNPLGATNNAIHVMKRTEPNSPPWKRAEAVIERQVKHQTRLVDDLLDVSRITRRKIVIQTVPLNLSQLVQETLEDHQGQFEQSDLTMQLDLPENPVWVLGDRTRLSQVLGNLLQNAAKFSPPGGSAIVKLEDSKRAERAVLSVMDTGIGFEPNLQDELFEPFVQTDRTLDRTGGGLGLGLALVKGLIELHGGGVSAHSSGAGKGATFSFWLPLLTSRHWTEVENGNQQTRTASHDPTLNILVIEDNRDVAQSLRDLLELFGHRVEVAVTGPSGVEAALRQNPDLVICDIGLPGMDGYEVAETLRSDPATRHIRMISLSGYGQEEYQARSKSVGFEAHLTKPIQPETLQRFISAPRGTLS